MADKKKVSYEISYAFVVHNFCEITMAFTFLNFTHRSFIYGGLTVVEFLLSYFFFRFALMLEKTCGCFHPSCSNNDFLSEFSFFRSAANVLFSCLFLSICIKDDVNELNMLEQRKIKLSSTKKKLKLSWKLSWTMNALHCYIKE